MRFITVLLVGMSTNFALANTQLEGSVELHAHLFMKKGLGWFFKGDFNDPLRAVSYTDRFASQANPEAVEKSGIQVLVATLYANPILKWALRDSIREQIGQAEEFVTKHPNWIIARDPKEAQKALSEGKKIMILALEGASGILETEDDLREFIDQRGIRIVTLLHLTDDDFGGVSFLRGASVLANPWSWIENLFRPSHDGKIRTNEHGLTTQGRKMAEALMQRGVWIDLAHASDVSTRTLIALYQKAKLPLLYTHTFLRTYHAAERAISQWQLEQVKASGGVVGLMPSEDMLAGTEVRSSLQYCSEGFMGLVQQYQELTQALGNTSVFLGTDYNGGVQHISPTCKTGTLLDTDGFWNISQAGALWAALKNAGASVPIPLINTAKRFLETWARVAQPSIERK